MKVPKEIDEILSDFDRKSEPFGEHDVKAAIIKVREQLKSQCDDEQNAGMWAELLAFALTPRERDNPWGTYFGPLSSWVTADGSMAYSPDIEGTDREAIAHWVGRAKTLLQPLLRARYADIAWDMSRAIADSRPDVEMARLAIDSYLESLLHRADIHNRFLVAIRALDLAVAITDDARIDASRAALLAHHKAAVEAKQPHWWHAPDRLLGDKRARVTEAERDQLLSDLESIARYRSDPSDPNVFDPHATEAAVKRLVRHMRREGRGDDARQWSSLVGKTFEHVASLGDGMVASSMLQVAVDAYREAGEEEEAKRARSAMETSIERSLEQMVPFVVENEISRDDMETFLRLVVLEDVGKTFARLAIEFLDRRNALVDQIAKQAEAAPLQASINQQLIYGPQVSAIVGPVKDDPEGRLIYAAGQNMIFAETWLLMAFSHAVEKLGIVPDHVVSWAARHGLFEDLSLLREGVVAWFEFDFVKSLHVLVPQVEHGLRGIADQLGVPVTKAHPNVRGASVAINMGDMLYNRPELTDALGDDLMLHFKALYADPRGFNLRNYLAHGLMDASAMTFGSATRVIHTLLVFGVWREIARARDATMKAE